MTKRTYSALRANAMALLSDSAADYSIDPSEVFALYVDFLDTLFDGADAGEVLGFAAGNTAWVAAGLGRSAVDARIATWARAGNAALLPRAKYGGNDLVAVLEAQSAGSRLSYGRLDDVPNIPPPLTAAQIRDRLGTLTTTDRLGRAAINFGGTAQQLITGAGGLAAIPAGLPAVTTSDNGEVLTVVNGIWTPAAASGGTTLPAYTVANNGQVLKIVNGALAWALDATATGGTGISQSQALALIATWARATGASGTIPQARLSGAVLVAVLEALSAGSRLSYNSLDDRPNIPTIPGRATTSADGLMSSSDKSKLDTVSRNAAPNPARVSSGEITAGTGTQIRSFAPADVNTFIANYGEAFTADDERKLDGIAAGAEVNVNADWDATSGDAFIRNKPTIPAAPSAATMQAAGIVELATASEVQTGTDGTRAVTPETLHANTATEARRGIIEIASDAEVKAGTDNDRAVTPEGLANVIPAATIANRSTSATNRKVVARSESNEDYELVDIDTEGGGSGGTAQPASLSTRKATLSLANQRNELAAVNYVIPENRIMVLRFTGTAQPSWMRFVSSASLRGRPTNTAGSAAPTSGTSNTQNFLTINYPYSASDGDTANMMLSRTAANGLLVAFVRSTTGILDVYELEGSGGSTGGAGSGFVELSDRRARMLNVTMASDAASLFTPNYTIPENRLLTFVATPASTNTNDEGFSVIVPSASIRALGRTFPNPVTGNFNRLNGITAAVSERDEVWLGRTAANLLVIGGSGLARFDIEIYELEGAGTGGGGGGLTQEQIEDFIAGTTAAPNTTGFLRAGTGISMAYDDDADTLTLSATGGTTPVNPNAHTMTRYLGISSTTTITDSALTSGNTSTSDTDDTFDLPTWSSGYNYVFAAVPDSTGDISDLVQVDAQGNAIALGDIPMQRIAGTRTVGGTVLKVWRSTDAWPIALSGRSVRINQR